MRHGEQLMPESEDDLANPPAGLCPLLLPDRVDETKGQHNLLLRQVSIRTPPGALTPQGYFALSVSPADPCRINLLVLRQLMDISKGTAAQEELPGEEVSGTAGCDGCVVQHRGSCQQTGREHISVLSSFPDLVMMQVVGG